jgi:hypothetical protein
MSAPNSNLTYRGPVDYYLAFVRYYLSHGKQPVRACDLARDTGPFREMHAVTKVTAMLNLLASGGLVKVVSTTKHGTELYGVGKLAIPLRYIELEAPTKGPSEQLRAWMPELESLV